MPFVDTNRAFSFRARKGTFKHRVGGFGKETAFLMGQFNESLGKLLDAVGASEDQARDAFGSQVVELFGAIVEMTPVDTGRARQGWRGPAFKHDLQGVTATITNTVHYIRWLEYGWSRQAPRGMVRVNIARFSAQLNRRLRGLLK